MPTTDELKAKFIAALQVARDTAAAVETRGDDFTAEERQKVSQALDEAKAVKAQLVQANGDAELREAIASLGDGVDLASSSNGKSASPPPGTPGAGKSLGERFVGSPEYQSWLKQIAPTGHIPDSAKGLVSPPVQFGGFKDLITGVSDTSGGSLIQNQYLGLLDQGRFQRPLTVRDAITVGRTTSDTVEYVRENTATNAAAAVAEATATATGGVKPESALTFLKVTATVRTIAHWIPATKRALADAGQLRTIIDAFLRYGLEEELEDQIANGNGVGENFTGILNTSGIQIQAWDTNLLTTTRRARTKVRTVGRATPNAFMLHPLDWEAIDLLQDNEARYYFGGPANIGAPRLWGLPVIESEAMPVGFGLVGDFRRAVLWDREQASIQVSDSHSDFFIRNLVAILAEMRAAFGVIRPSAFVNIDLTAL